MKFFYAFLSSLGLAFVLVIGPVRIAAAQSAAPSNSPATIAPGTVITTQNWRDYQQFMSVGLIDLFTGKYFWKMPADAQIDVGPTVIHPLPRTYLAATEKYASQVKVVALPDGGLTLEGYRGGLPFPDPAEPHKGWKILADNFFRYIPNAIAIEHAGGCMIDSSHNINCAEGDLVYRQLSFNTDPGVPATIPGGEGKFWTQWYIITEPEQQKYTASLTISFTDPRRNEALYAFIPALRRYQPLATGGRCSTTEGSDVTPEDYRSGFDSNITQLTVDYLGDKRILALILPQMPGAYPDDYDMPLGWPKPSWGKWQVRDVYVISVSKVPSQAAGYCYGKRVMYVDKTSFLPYTEELYDMHNRLWKIAWIFPRTVEVPGLGPQDSSGSLIYAFWDIQNNHASFIRDPTLPKYPFYVNDQLPAQYRDMTRYTSPAGLGMIMR